MTSLLNIAGNIPVSAAAVAGQSLRFDDGDSPYLSWTPASAGNRKTWTWSGWVKRGNLGTNQYIFGANAGIYVDGGIAFNSSNSIAVILNGNVYNKNTSAVFRDTSAWYHIVVALDTDNATAADRIKIYVNGVEQTNYFTNNSGLPPSGYTPPALNNANNHNLGKLSGSSSNYFDGYLANVCFIDGTALDPTSFGEYQDTLWKPKSDTDIQSLTFGTNGFYIPFKQTTEAEGFSTVTYTGNGGTQSIEGVGFEPSLVWIKGRNNSGVPLLQDSIRGSNGSKYRYLISSETSAEAVQTDNDGIDSLDSNGFTVGYSNSNAWNQSGGNYVAWCWDAGTGSAASNTDGSITSTVKANTAKGFSIVSWIDNASTSSTVGHGLNSAPELIITKNRDGAFNWFTWTTVIDGSYDYLSLNRTDSKTDDSTRALPTSSVFTNVGSTSGNKQIAYCFHSVSGYSSIGSYTGTGAAGNSITGLGFKPAWIIIKETTNAGSWHIYDNTRNPVNPASYLLADTSNTEDAFGAFGIDFDSDGFTIQNTGNGTNRSGGTYIYMAFADTRDATFFGDTSGNGNNWTPNALNNTDVVPDSPVTGGNFAVLNPLTLYTSNTSLAEGNLKANAVSSGSGSNWGTVFSSITLPTTGKYYVEGRAFINTGSGNSSHLGVLDTSSFVPAHNNATYSYTTGEGFDGIYLTLFNNYAQPVSDGVLGTAEGSITGTSALVMLAVDIDNGKVWAGYDGTWLNSGDPAAGTNEIATRTFSDTDAIAVGTAYNGSNDQGMFANFGQDSSFAGNETPQGNTDENGVGDFYYAPPSGFLALTTSNLPPATITAPDDYFNTVLYTGTGATRSVTGVGFQPDWIWTKARSNASNHNLIDAVRGTNKLLLSDVTDAEYTQTIIDSFDSDGFTTSSSASGINLSGYTYVAWNWLAGNGTVSNTDGSITSTVSANTDAGFSVVGYTGTGSSATVGHGLSSAPEIVIVKNRDSATNWPVYTTVVDGTYDFLYLNLTNAAGDASALSTPTSSVFSLGSSSTSNESGSGHIAYCFHSVESYSKCGVYTGNGSTDGTFVHCGFRPAFVLTKRSSGSGAWAMSDTSRSPDNVVQEGLEANTSLAEFNSSNYYHDILSNGFKLRSSDDAMNGSGSTYIFLAFAESPFSKSNAR